MPFWTGVSQGLSKGIDAERSRQADLADRQHKEESAILQHLSTSDDPEIASKALAGLMDHAAGVPKKGLRGFLGEMEGHPALPTLRALIQSGRQVPNEVQGDGPAPPPMLAADTQGAATMPDQPLTQQPPSRGMPPGPVQFHQEPRPVFLPQAERTRRDEEAKIQGGLDAYTGAMSRARGNPQAEAIIRAKAGIHQPVPRYLGKPQGKHLPAGTLDVNGQPLNPDQYYRQEQLGEEVHYFPDTGPPPARPSGPEAQALERAREIQATAEAAGQPPLTADDALKQARQEQRSATQTKAVQQTTLTAARLASLKAGTLATWQRTAGTTPMNEAQALTAARQALGNDPAVTVGDVTALADSLRAGGGGKGGPPPTSGASVAPGGPAAAPPPARSTPGPGAISGRVPSDLANRQRNYHAYSAQGKQSLVAINVLEGTLPKIEANIRQAGLQNDASPISESLQKYLYSLGFAPEESVEQRLQLTGLTEAYGLRGLLVGRANLPLQQIMQMHLVQPGDSPKLILQKIASFKEAIPIIKQAIDTAETAKIGGKPPVGGGPAATAPPTAPSAVTTPTPQDLAGLSAGKQRTFTTGPFAGQSWTIVNGQPHRVK